MTYVVILQWSVIHYYCCYFDFITRGYFFEVEVRKMQWFGEEQFLQLASSAKDTKQTGTKIMRKTSRRSAASRRILFAIIRIHQQSKLLSSC